MNTRLLSSIALGLAAAVYVWFGIFLGGFDWLPRRPDSAIAYFACSAIGLFIGYCRYDSRPVRP